MVETDLADLDVEVGDRNLSHLRPPPGQHCCTIKYMGWYFQGLDHTDSYLNPMESMQCVHCTTHLRVVGSIYVQPQIKCRVGTTHPKGYDSSL